MQVSLKDNAETGEKPNSSVFYEYKQDKQPELAVSNEREKPLTRASTTDGFPYSCDRHVTFSP